MEISPPTLDHDRARAGGTRVRLAAFALGLAMLTAQACSHSHEGKPTGATCPTASTLTYAGFGQPFFNEYCQRCHGDAVTGAARNGAPDDHTFDNVLTIRALTDHIDVHAGAGPIAVNTEMPPSAPIPTETERRQLSEWLACGAP